MESQIEAGDLVRYEHRSGEITLMVVTETKVVEDFGRYEPLARCYHGGTDRWYRIAMLEKVQ